MHARKYHHPANGAEPLEQALAKLKNSQLFLAEIYMRKPPKPLQNYITAQVETAS
jgi:hypothetical protein